MHGEVGLGLCAVKMDQDLALGDVIAFGDREGFHDAAFTVLHGLAVAVHHDRAAADDGAIQRRERGPRAETPEGNGERSKARFDCSLHDLSVWRREAKLTKVFWFFFSKKNYFLPYALMATLVGLLRNSLVRCTFMMWPPTRVATKSAMRTRATL